MLFSSTAVGPYHDCRVRPPRSRQDHTHPLSRKTLHQTKPLPSQRAYHYRHRQGFSSSLLLSFLFSLFSDSFLTSLLQSRRVTFFECGNDLNGMLDVCKVADLVLMLIDASFGFEMEVSLPLLHPSIFCIFVPSAYCFFFLLSYLRCWIFSKRTECRE